MGEDPNKIFDTKMKFMFFVPTSFNRQYPYMSLDGDEFYSRGNLILEDE